VGENHQQHLTILRPVVACMNNIAQTAFNHAENSFNLPTLAIQPRPCLKFQRHQATISAFGYLSHRRATNSRWYHGRHMQNFTSMPVISFAVVARVGQQCINADIRIEAIQGFQQTDAHPDKVLAWLWPPE
jgi:hypothetical protein